MNRKSPAMDLKLRFINGLSSLGGLESHLWSDDALTQEEYFHGLT